MAGPITYWGDSPRVRETFKVRWERRIHPDDVGMDEAREQRRRTFALVFRVECATGSTVLKEFDDYIDQADIDAPAILTPSPVPGAPSTEIKYTGSWGVDEIDVSDEPGGKSVVRVSLTRYEDWQNIGD
jgi:hypothetical protein